MVSAHRTEAACLLEQGATYRRRIGLQPRIAQAEPVFAGFKPGAFSLYFGDAPIYHFDLEGRWQRAFVEGTHFLKGLDACVQTIDRVRQGPSLVLKRRTLADLEAADFDARVRSMALGLIASLDAGQLARVNPPSSKAQPLDSDELREFLERISRWDQTLWLAHRERYRSIYGPLPFLPPECQNGVVLQATLGQSGRFGTGCPTPHEPWARSVSEFERHARDVAALWGRRLTQSRVVVLAGSDVLHRPAEDVAGYLNAASNVFSIKTATQPGTEAEQSASTESTHRLEGIHAVLDDFDASLHARKSWADYAARGLSRVSLLIESGDPGVRARYLKTWRDNDLRATFAGLNAAGLGASVLTLVGAGGVEGAGAHLARTAPLFTSLDLGPGDFVFLLDENELCDPEWAPGGVIALQEPGWSQAQTSLMESLAPLKKRGVKVLAYTLEKQSI
jgi:hypothetical protein